MLKWIFPLEIEEQVFVQKNIATPTIETFARMNSESTPIANESFIPAFSSGITFTLSKDTATFLARSK